MAGPTDWPRTLSLAVHELRSPVNVAGGYLKMLRDSTGHPLDEHQRRLVELALKSWTRTVALLADLSELGKIEGGISVLPRVAFDLDQVLAAVIAAFVPPLETGVTAERVGEGAGRVLGDPDGIRRALAACLTAIAREIPADGRVLLEARRPPAEGYVSVLIADTVSAASLPDRVDGWGELDEWRGGLGLELPLARRIVEAAGGKLSSPSGARRPALRCELPSART